MFENLGNFFKRMVKTEQQKELGSKLAAKERLHLVLMQDRANVSADFLELMKQEIIDVIKKYIVVDEDAIDVRLTNKSNEDGTNGAPALYANIPIVNIKNDMMAEKIKQFEGVDFNKEMGITPAVVVKEDENSDVTIELSESYEKQSVVEEIPENIDYSENQESNNTQESVKENNSENYEYIEGNEETDAKEIFEEVDEDDEDDDVTFDDLLKAAEEADKKAVSEIDPATVTKVKNTKRGRPKSATSNETKDKSKKKN